MILYRLIYWIFIFHFVRIAFLIKEHWNQMEYEAWFEELKFYLETHDYGNYGKNSSKKGRTKKKGF